MQFLILSFLTSCAVSVLVVRYADTHPRILAHHDTTGPQKIHSHPVPRIGGVGVFAGVLAGIVWAQISQPAGVPLMSLLLLAAMPAFLSGLAEDMAWNILPRWRLVLIAVYKTRLAVSNICTWPLPGKCTLAIAPVIAAVQPQGAT